MLKVYVGLLPKGLAQSKGGTGKVRTIVAASSLKEAAAKLNYNHSTVKNFFDISTDPVEIGIANKSPNTVFQSSSVIHRDYAEVPR